MKQKLVVRIHADHPLGQYIVCGYRILPEYQLVEDEPAIIQQMQQDPNLIIAPMGSRPWCEACGIEFCEEELKKLGLDVHGQPLKKTVEAKPEAKAAAKTTEVATNRFKVIAELKAKGQVEGKDFNKTAKTEDLIALLNSL